MKHEAPKENVFVRAAIKDQERGARDPVHKMNVFILKTAGKARGRIRRVYILCMHETAVLTKGNQTRKYKTGVVTTAKGINVTKYVIVEKWVIHINGK